MWYCKPMLGPDFDRIHSEQKRSLAEFIALYNAGLPSEFPRVTPTLLERYRLAYPSQFKPDGLWSLDLHRKRVMDWLPEHLESFEAVVDK